jgi:hypothetical protein
MNVRRRKKKKKKGGISPLNHLNEEVNIDPPI